jgi:hypothetical protein
MKRIVLILVTAGALIAGARSVAQASPAHHGRSALSLAAGRAAISRYALDLRDAVAGAQPDAPISAGVDGCRRGGSVVTCMASWTFAGTRCSVEIAAVDDRGVLVEELGEATCARPASPQPGA